MEHDENMSVGVDLSVTKDNTSQILIDAETGELLNKLGVSINEDNDYHESAADIVEKHYGIEFKKDAETQEVLDTIDKLANEGDYSQEELDDMYTDLVKSIKVPEVIEEKENLDTALGLDADDLLSLYKYLSGKGDKPEFLERYLADNQNKLTNFQHIVTLIRLSYVPQLAALEASIQKRLYSPENLASMNVKDLTAASASLSKEMSDILNSSAKTIETLNTVGGGNNKYRSIMDRLLVAPEPVLSSIEHLLSNYE